MVYVYGHSASAFWVTTELVGTGKGRQMNGWREAEEDGHGQDSAEWGESEE
jgi:hypothetical protein